jgi:hypothetical protein
MWQLTMNTPVKNSVTPGTPTGTEHLAHPLLGYLLALFTGLPVPASATDPGDELFTEIAEDAGLHFQYFNGMSGEYYFPENLGGGVALFDYDKDGDLDVYLTQGHMLGEGKTLKDALFPPRAGTRFSDRLFRNDIALDGNGKPVIQFTDVTEAAGIDAAGYGMGVTTADIDNDGWVDLFVANFGSYQLLHNNGDGTFNDVTQKAGVDAPGWGVSAAFLDFDRDGHLDLYVANYVHFELAKNKPCYGLSGARDYCGPNFFRPMQDRLYRNRGDGTFEDVSVDAGINHAAAPGLGVISGDFNQDGWMDIYVANDGEANQLWVNQKDGTFKDEAFMAGVAVNMEGAPEASMGVDAADFDGDGDEDLFMTHLLGETNTIYVNDGEGWFEDRSIATGLAAPSKGYTAFGTTWFDYNNDGWLDLFVANGDVRVMPILVRAGDRYPLHQPNQLFANEQGKFKDITAQAGTVFQLSEVSRGVAVGDVDNDGDSDIVVANSNGPVRLLINNTGNRNHWLGLRLLNEQGQDAIGARAVIRLSDDRSLWRRVHVDGSYASASDPRILAGLGDSSKIRTTLVYWPSGSIEEWPDLAVDRFHTLVAGQGKPVKKP